MQIGGFEVKFAPNAFILAKSGPSIGAFVPAPRKVELDRAQRMLKHAGHAALVKRGMVRINGHKVAGYWLLVSPTLEAELMGALQ